MSDITESISLRDRNAMADFDWAEKTWIQVLKVSTYVVAGFLVFMSVLNGWYYLVKQKRYTDPSIVLFYFNGLLIIFEVVKETINVGAKDICPFSEIIDNYGDQMLNLNLGICQAGMITALAFNLHELFKFKGDLESQNSSREE